MSGAAAIAAREVRREYRLGGSVVAALRGVSFDVAPDDYVAITGPSGSGKSTLMHLLGGLDRPTGGQLRIGGADIATLSPSALAALRNRTIGFIFQAFHLLPRTTATDNVALPLVYRGVGLRRRRARARVMLERVGLAHRADHRPHELSGGEQQRVAIARALVTDPLLLLADEPTGNLDSASGRTVLALLERLHADGVAVVLVTHDREVAARARRQVVIRDGRVAEETGVSPAEAWRVALVALAANRLRSALTMVGVVVGVAAVVVLVAIGAGTRTEVERQVAGLGANLLMVLPGKAQWGTPSASRMTLADAAAVADETGARGTVTPVLSSGERVTTRGHSRFTRVLGGAETGARVMSRELARGSYLDRTDVRAGRRLAVLGSTVAESLLPGREPVGSQIKIRGVPYRVIGVFAPMGQSLGVDRDDEVHIPIAAAQRLLSTSRVDAILVRANDSSALPPLTSGVLARLARANPDTQFSIITQGQILGVMRQLVDLLTATLIAIASISLIVGGVGVSNVMLVSVRERRREIGLRKAVGARPRDLVVQFLCEAVMLTVLGGVAGIGVGLVGAWLIATMSPMPVLVTGWSAALAVGVSVTVGLLAGVLPAYRAGRLDPVVSLRGD